MDQHVDVHVLEIRLTKRRKKRVSLHVHVHNSVRVKTGVCTSVYVHNYS